MPVPPVDDSRVVDSRPLRLALIGVGGVAVALGAIGVVVPGLPTTGFMVFAAWCFSRSSPRFEAWVLDLPGVGPSVRAYRAGEGMPRRAKVVAITMMVTAVGLSTFALRGSPVIQVIVVGAGCIGVYWVGIRVPTRDPGRAPAGRA